MKRENRLFFKIYMCILLVYIIVMTIIRPSFELVDFAVLFLLSFPLILVPEYFLSIALMVSTISYHFYGASEHVLSIYSILIILLLLKGSVLSAFKIKNKGMFALSLLLCFLAAISYRYSHFNYTNGFIKFIYTVIVSIIVGDICKLDFKKIMESLPLVAQIIAFYYLISELFTGGIYIEGRMTIAQSVNTNTFGFSCAMIIIVLLTSFFLNRKKKHYLILSIIMLALELLSGSRGSLLAIIGSSVASLFLLSNKKKELIKNFLKVTPIVIALFCLIYICIPLLNINVNRYDVSAIIDSGGSNRMAIYENVLHFIINNGYWKIGYGPGHDCSRLVLYKLMHRNYFHTHNTLIEAFGELGIVGLIILVLFYINSYFSIKKNLKYDDILIVIYGLLVGLMINGMVESYFCYCIMWIIFALCRNNSITINEKSGD